MVLSLLPFLILLICVLRPSGAALVVRERPCATCEKLSGNSLCEPNPPPPAASRYRVLPPPSSSCVAARSRSLFETMFMLRQVPETVVVEVNEWSSHRLTSEISRIVRRRVSSWTAHEAPDASTIKHIE